MERDSGHAIVAAARAKYGFVKDSYASTAHLLTEPQRREMRSYLARLTGLVNDLETSHQSPSLEPLKDALQLTIARASTTAPEITAAVMRSEPKPRASLLRTIGDAMKLRP